VDAILLVPALGRSGQRQASLHRSAGGLGDAFAHAVQPSGCGSGTSERAGIPDY